MKSIAAVAALALAALAPAAWSQAWPAKPIKILVGVTPGGTTDTLARFLGQEMSKDLGQPVVVENKPGAGGNIAAEAVARSAPDGYTLVFVNTSHSVNMGLYGPRVPYDAVKDFTPITQVSTGPAVLVAAKDFPANDAKDVIAMARAQPGKLDFAIGGLGTSIHMAGELFKMMAGVEITNIPYKGSSPALMDVVGGQVKLMFAPVINAVPQVKAGKVKALGVTSKTRIPALPDVAPIADVVPGYESAAYFGLLGPANLPRDVLARLHASAAKAAQSPELKSRLEPDGSRVVGGTPEEFRAFLVADVEKWRQVVKATGAKAE
ncbi:MAG TPA: tripartite tricarboxylate transporter substrate binding protein [Usitatibacteraceae bacterium]|nr:tripartite tricarboxylate transporter substrate binding protein [Usitatibacteraceae bacterium]